MRPATRPIAIALAYLALHLLMEWGDYLGAYGSPGGAPWNPAAGLGIVFVCRYGRRFAAFIPIASVLSALLFHEDGSKWAVSLAAASISGIGHAGAALLLAWPRLGFSAALAGVRDIVVLQVVGAASSAVVAAVLFAALIAGGLGEYIEVVSMTVRLLVGDMLGVAIVAPLGLLALEQRLPRRITRRGLSQACLAALTLAAVIVFTEAGRLPYFYFLFFPLIWIALTEGLEGACVFHALVQAAMLVATQAMTVVPFDVVDFQARMVALVATGLIAGALVAEREAGEERIRQQQIALSAVAARGMMGELGTAIAHEVNQPLSAAMTYASLVVDTVAGATPPDAALLDNAQKIVRQIERASTVVRRVRSTVRLARDARSRIAVAPMLDEVADLMRTDATRTGVALQVVAEVNLPAVNVDRLQIELALVNLVRNAIDAIGGAGASDGRVVLFGRMASGGEVEIGVEDDGPGFPAGFTIDAVVPFNTSKPEGFGIGLSLCRSIAHANDAILRIRQLDRGTEACLVLRPDGR